MTAEQIENGAKALYNSVPWHQEHKPILWDDLDKHEPELCEMFQNDSRTYFLAALAFIREQAKAWVESEWMAEVVDMEELNAFLWTSQGHRARKGWRERVTRTWIEHRSAPGVFESGEVRCIRTFDNGRWHLSISTTRPGYPTWDEIADARYDLLPGDADFALILPPVNDYINLQGPGVPHVFHLYEIRDADLPIERGFAMPRTHESGVAVDRGARYDAEAEAHDDV